MIIEQRCAMASVDAVSDSVVRRGREIYDRDLRAKLEASDRGRFAAIDPASGDYAVADDELGAVRALRENRGDVRPYIVRIGSKAAYRLGGPIRVEG
jgi:hypothetical protein